MAKARTLPSSSCETNLPLQRVMLCRDETHDNSDTPLQHAVPSTEDIDAEGQDQDSDIEYDSYESVENDVASTVSYDEPQLASEVPSHWTLIKLRKDDPFKWEIYSVVDCGQCLPSHWNDWNRNDENGPIQLLKTNQPLRVIIQPQMTSFTRLKRLHHEAINDPLTSNSLLNN